MKDAILLPITGSRESMFAMELAFALARKTGATLNAQHVVNVDGALRCVGLEQPGIVGSGPYVDAYERVCSALRDIGSLVIESYTARAGGQSISGKVFTDEGEPIDQICKRAAEHQLVVMGHRLRPAADSSDCQPAELSFAEKMTLRTATPVMIVEEQVTDVAELSLLCSLDHINAAWINNCLATAKNLGLACSITFLAAGAREQEPMQFVQDFRTAYPAFSELPIRLLTRTGGGVAQLSAHNIENHNPEHTILTVVPTVGVSNHRTAPNGECPVTLLRRLAFDAVMIWPEEFQRPLFAAKNQVGVSAAT